MGSKQQRRDPLPIEQLRGAAGAGVAGGGKRFVPAEDTGGG
jgi:hypothetical protein